MTFLKKHSHLLILILIITIGLFLRLYKIDFGRPQSFLYDENDIYDDAIRISQNYKFIIENEGWLGFKPSSFVYGTFPTYFLVFSTMIFNKIISILHAPIDMDFYFVYMRIITALFSFLTVIFSSLLYKKIFKDKNGTLITFILAAINWKLIAQSHYLNHDTFLTVFTTASLYFFISYINDPKKKFVNAMISAFFLGLTAGTKITGLIIAPIIGIILIYKKDWKSLGLYLLFTIIGFSLSNPFSIIYFTEFLERVVGMKSVEAGIIFGDINYNPFRYPLSFLKLLTPAIFLLSSYGFFEVIKKQIVGIKNKKIENNFETHVTLVSTIFIYIIFYSLTPRLTERWMVPIIPIWIVYGAKAFVGILEKYSKRKTIVYLVYALILSSSLFHTFSLIRQLNMEKPRSEAYVWFSTYLKDNNLNKARVLMYTNKGYKDPFSRLDNCDLTSYKVYEARGAQNVYPKDPFQYEYVILYSTMEKNYENNYVKNKYPEYYKLWSNFAKTVKDPENFKLLRKFETTKLDLIGIPEISIYENTKKASVNK